MSARVIIEVRVRGGVHRVERDANDENWLSDERNASERRATVIEAVNDLLRSLNLAPIVEAEP